MDEINYPKVNSVQKRLLHFDPKNFIP